MEPTPPIDLVVSFGNYFTVAPALDTEQQLDTYRIRHAVYCQDLGWEPVRPDGMESDLFDAHSVACLMRSASTGALVGTVRLVLCKPEDPDSPLPMEIACANTIDRSIFDPATVDRRRIAEVSRLAVMPDYRRRKGEADKPVSLELSDFGEANRQRFPYIPVGLYLSAFASAEHLGIDYLLVLTEPRLARHLSILGIKIVQIGGPIEHRGVRIPSLIETRSTIANFHPLLAQLWPHIHADAVATFAASAAASAATAPA